MRYIPEPIDAPTEIQAGAIFVWENAVPDWKEIIETLESKASEPESGIFFQNATTTDGNALGKRRNKVLYITQAAEARDKYGIQIHNRIGLLLASYLTYYASFFETTFNMTEGFSLLKYSGATSDHYDAHYDGGAFNNRWISAIIYLNDDYDGGEIEFPDHRVKIKPKAGTLMIFPSNYAYRHIAHNVIKGTKYAIVTWISE